MSIADRSLSRLRGSPLPGAGCLSPGSCVGAFILLYAYVQVLSLAQVRLSYWVLLRRLRRRYAFGLAVPFGFRLGAWPVVSRGLAYPAGCSCGGYAAGARLGWLCHLGLAGCVGRCLASVCVSCLVQLRRLCRRYAFGLAVPLGFGRVLGVCLAWMRLTGLVQLRRLCRRCAFGLAVPLGFGRVLGVCLAWARLSCRMQLRRLCRRCAFWWLCPWVWAGCMAAWMCCGYAGHRRSFSPYKQSPPLRGGCRRQPAGGGVVRAPIPPASLIPGRSGSYVSACAVRRDLRPAALQLFTTAPSVSEYFALYLQYDCTAARQRYAAKTAAAANSGWGVWAWPYLQKGGPVTVRPTE